MLRSHVGFLSFLLLCNAAAAEDCPDAFEKRGDDFVLDTEDSVKVGATYLDGHAVSDPSACVSACCAHPECNLALVNQSKPGETVCFTFNCVYKRSYVCKFAAKKGFSNFIRKTVYDEYLKGRGITTGEDRPPVAKAGPDQVVQPLESVTLNGIGSVDDHKIEIFNWKMVSGKPGIVMEKTTFPDQVIVSNLSAGVYKFQLTVVDSVGQTDSANITVLVLTPEQTENHCLVPKKVGPCRGSFPRFHYSAISEKCESFVFGGCRGNKNNYLSDQECKEACEGVSVHDKGRSGPRPIPKMEICGTPCTRDQFSCHNGCCLTKDLECDGETQCSDGSDEASCDRLVRKFDHLLEIPVDKQKVLCTDPPITGPCRASITHWYYDPFSSKCFRFNYGGCDGNENRFVEEDSCMNTCRMVTDKDVMARGVFEFQESKKNESGAIAIAVLLGVAILILLAILGYCALKTKKDRAQQHQRVPPVNSHHSNTEDMQRLVYNSTTKPI